MNDINYNKKFGPDLALDVLNKIELILPVDQWVINDVHIWPIIRMHIFFALRNHYTDSTQPYNPHHKFSYIVSSITSRLYNHLQYFRAFFSDYSNNARWSPTNVLFLGDQVSRVLLNGHWYDKLCEPIMEYLRKNKNLTCLHMDPNHSYRVPRHTPSIFIQPHLDMALLRSLKNKKNFADSLEKLEGINEINSYLKLLDRDIPEIKLSRISFLLSYIIEAAAYFDTILSRTMPKLVFVVEYYGKTGMALNLACHRLGITTIEVPHGNHGEIHPAYSRWNKVPSNGYELLPEIFWCWSENEASAVRQWSNLVGGAHQVIIGGNWWLNLWFKNDSPIVRSYDSKAREIIQKTRSKLHILATYEFDYLHLLDIIDQAPLDWHWWIRIHPTKLFDREKIRKLLQTRGNNNYTIDNATDLPLYALLRNVDAHITECSSVVIEAESFHVPSVITRTYGTAAFKRQISSGWAISAYSNRDIISTIQSFARQGKRSWTDQQRTTTSWTSTIDTLIMEAMKISPDPQSSS